MREEGKSKKAKGEEYEENEVMEVEEGGGVVERKRGEKSTSQPTLLRNAKKQLLSCHNAARVGTPIRRRQSPRLRLVFYSPTTALHNLPVLKELP